MFKVGDIVTGTGDRAHDYAYTGVGSICEVVTILPAGRMTVKVLTPSPGYCAPGTEWDVEQTYFVMKLEAKAMKQKIEAIKIFYCQQALRNVGECGEVAEHRITIPGLAITLCGPHARPYIKGETTLSPILCKSDGQICKPGFVRDSDWGHPFCNEDCRTAWLNRDQRQQYAASF